MLRTLNVADAWVRLRSIILVSVDYRQDRPRVFLHVHIHVQLVITRVFVGLDSCAAGLQRIDMVSSGLVLGVHGRILVACSMDKVVLGFLRARAFPCSEVAHDAVLLAIAPPTHVTWPCLGLFGSEAYVVCEVSKSFVSMIVQLHIWLLHSVLADGSLGVKRNLGLIGRLRSVQSESCLVRRCLLSSTLHVD